MLYKSGKSAPSFQYIVADFKNSSMPGFYDKILKQLSNIKVGILVNNVGTGDTNFIYNFTTQQIIDMININCISMAALTALLIPHMR